MSLTSQHSSHKLLTLHGVPRHGSPKDGELVYALSAQGAWRPIPSDLLEDIELECVRLHDAFASAIFGEIGEYHRIARLMPEFIPIAGLNSESTMTRDDFERTLARFRHIPYLNQLLYLFDCSNLVAGVQECTKEVCFLCGEFFRSLNLDELHHGSAGKTDGVRWVTSPTVTRLIATLNVIYVRLHSLLDYMTKLVHEIEHLHSDFTTYPKLASSKILFGDRRQVGWDDVAGTLFEDDDLIVEIESFRNLIIHDGLLDDMPKAYQVVHDGGVVEKFVLMPDRTSGRLDRYKNRKLFFGREDRINLRLPSFILAFQEKQVVTLRRAHARLSDASRA